MFGIYKDGTFYFQMENMIGNICKAVCNGKRQYVDSMYFIHIGKEN